MTDAGGGDWEASIADDESVVTNAAQDPKSGANPRGLTGRLRLRRELIRRRPMAYRLYRVAVGLVGGAIMVGGLALIPLPGPGWVIIFLGLAVLGTEFTWADRLEKFARSRVRVWSQWVANRSIPVRGVIGVSGVICVAAVLYGLFALTSVPGWIPDAWVPDLPGLD